MMYLRFPYLEKWISDHGMTVNGFAQYAGISRTTLQKMLDGETDPKKTTIDRILKVTGMRYEKCFAEVVEHGR